MPGLGSLFGRGSIGEQLFVWGLLSQIVQALTAPGIIELQQLAQSTVPNVALSPAELAQLVNRGFMAAGAASGEASKSGIDGSRFTHLVDLAGEAPGPAELTEALRRGIISEDAATGGLPSFIDGIRQGNLRNVWAPLYKALAVQLPSWSDALDALLEGQLDEATARHWYGIAGGDPDAFTWLFNTRGSAPTPDMLGLMANRGIIGWDGTGPNDVTFQQGFLEGPWRNKWLEPMRALMAYHPPPRTVTAMFREGALTQDEALTLLKQQGLTPALAAAYIKGTTSHKAATAKTLTEGQIEALLTEKIITATQAETMLAGIGVSASDAHLLITHVGLTQAISNTKSAVSRIRTLYVGRKITGAAATAALGRLGVDAGQAGELVATWDIEQAASVKTLSEAQIAGAVHVKAMTVAEGIQSLGAIGYDAYDAWVILSIREGGPLPDKPPRTIDPIGTTHA